MGNNLTMLLCGYHWGNLWYCNLLLIWIAWRANLNEILDCSSRNLTIPVFNLKFFKITKYYKEYIGIYKEYTDAYIGYIDPFSNISSHLGVY